MPTAEKVIDALGTGRRKTSVARVRIRAGSGKLTINDRDAGRLFQGHPGPQRGGLRRSSTRACVTAST